MGVDSAEGSIVIETIEVAVEFPTRTVDVRIEIVEEQPPAIEAMREVERAAEHQLDGLDLLDSPRLTATLTGWARTAKPPAKTVALWCYLSRLPDLLSLLDPLGAGPPFVIKVEPPPAPTP